MEEKQKNTLIAIAVVIVLCIVVYGGYKMFVE